jgi:hypothetical protein
VAGNPEGPCILAITSPTAPCTSSFCSIDRCVVPLPKATDTEEDVQDTTLASAASGKPVWPIYSPFARGATSDGHDHDSVASESDAFGGSVVPSSAPLLAFAAAPSKYESLAPSLQDEDVPYATLAAAGKRSPPALKSTPEDSDAATRDDVCPPAVQSSHRAPPSLLAAEISAPRNSTLPLRNAARAAPPIIVNLKFCIHSTEATGNQTTCDTGCDREIALPAVRDLASKHTE